MWCVLATTGQVSLYVMSWMRFLEAVLLGLVRSPVRSCMGMPALSRMLCWLRHSMCSRSAAHQGDGNPQLSQERAPSMGGEPSQSVHTWRATC